MSRLTLSAVALLVLGCSSTAMALPQVTILATGGTIAGGGNPPRSPPTLPVKSGLKVW